MHSQGHTHKYTQFKKSFKNPIFFFLRFGYNMGDCVWCVHGGRGDIRVARVQQVEFPLTRLFPLARVSIGPAAKPIYLMGKTSYLFRPSLVEFKLFLSLYRWRSKSRLKNQPSRVCWDTPVAQRGDRRIRSSHLKLACAVRDHLTTLSLSLSQLLLLSGNARTSRCTECSLPGLPLLALNL